jgi:hypothetical protein
MPSKQRCPARSKEPIEVVRDHLVRIGEVSADALSHALEAKAQSYCSSSPVDPICAAPGGKLSHLTGPKRLNSAEKPTG